VTGPTERPNSSIGANDHRLSLDDIEPIAIAGYIEQLGINAAKPMVKQKPGGYSAAV
jgi:hypothetical protein